MNKVVTVNRELIERAKRAAEIAHYSDEERGGRLPEGEKSEWQELAAALHAILFEGADA